jgi:hypothetical protein
MLPQRLSDALDALEADASCRALGRASPGVPVLQAQRGQRFERFVTDWEFREYATTCEEAPMTATTDQPAAPCGRPADLDLFDDGRRGPPSTSCGRAIPATGTRNPRRTAGSGRSPSTDIVTVSRDEETFSPRSAR